MIGHENSPQSDRPPRLKYCTANGMKLFNIAHRRMTGYGRSAVNISSLANGALGEHRRHDTDGIKHEIAAPGCRTVSTRVAAEPAGAVCATPKDTLRRAVRGRMLLGSL